MKKRRISRYEAKLNFLIEEQQKDASTSKIFPEVIRPSQDHNFYFMPGDTARDKVYWILFKLGWTETMVSEALRVSRRTVQRKRACFKYYGWL